MGLATMLSLPRVVMDVAMFSEQVNIENVKVALSCHLWPLEQKKNRNSNVCKCQRIQ